MKIKVYVVDLELSPRARRLLRGALVTVGTLLFFATAVSAAPPHTFTTGETLTAATLMQNFNDLDARVAALESFKSKATQNGTTTSLGSKYCGVTAGFYNGAAVGGYSGARTKCGAVGGACSATAHMCTAEEVMRSRSLGATLPADSWFATGQTSIGGTDLLFDCGGWIENSASYRGSVLGSTGWPGSTTCSTTRQILCCD